MTKPVTAWVPRQAGTVTSSSTEVILTTQAAVTLTTQALVTLILNPNTFTPKPRTAWT